MSLNPLPSFGWPRLPREGLGGSLGTWGAPDIGGLDMELRELLELRENTEEALLDMEGLGIWDAGCSTGVSRS